MSGRVEIESFFRVVFDILRPDAIEYGLSIPAEMQGNCSFPRKHLRWEEVPARILKYIPRLLAGLGGKLNFLRMSMLIQGQ